MVRIIKPVAGLDEIIGRGDAASRIRDNTGPAIVASPGFERPHQAELQSLAPMLAQHTDPAEIAGIHDMGRRSKPRECNRQTIAESEPPMSKLKFRYWCALEESQPVEIAKRIRDIFVERVDLPYLVHCLPRISLAENDLDAEPHRADESGNQHCDGGLESVTLRLLDAFPPTA